MAEGVVPPPCAALRCEDLIRHHCRPLDNHLQTTKTHCSAQKTNDLFQRFFGLLVIIRRKDLFQPSASSPETEQQPQLPILAVVVTTRTQAFKNISPKHKNCQLCLEMLQEEAVRKCQSRATYLKFTFTVRSFFSGAE